MRMHLQPLHANNANTNHNHNINYSISFSSNTMAAGGCAPASPAPEKNRFFMGTFCPVSASNRQKGWCFS